ncbi:MAG: hypothetical protein FWC97_01825 [Treponema sp.]|nr:hypothetical protein [Treponema sp.]
MKNFVGILKVAIFGLAAIFFLLSCGGDDDPPLPQSAAPTAENYRVSKIALVQPVIQFTLTSEHPADSVWRVYNVPTGGSVINTITVEYFPPHDLLWTSAAGDFEVGSYWLTVTERGRAESRRLLLMIDPMPQTPTPAALEPVYDKTNFQQRDVRFNLSGDQFAIGTIWRVYNSEIGDSVPENVSVVYHRAIHQIALTTTDADLPDGFYWVTATEGGKTESQRLVLLVRPFLPPEVSSAPFSFTDTIAKTASPQREVSINLITNHPSGTEWFVYNVAAGGAALSEVTAVFEPLTRVLTLSASGGDLSPGVYFIAAREFGREESARFVLTILPFTASNISAKPMAAVTDTIIAKTSALQTLFEFNLISDHPSGAVWNVYNSAVGGTPLITVNASFNTAARVLSLAAAGGANDIAPATYFVAVTESGRLESERLALTIIPFVPPVSAIPTVNAENASVTKTAVTQASVNFTLSSSHTGTWRVYNSNGVLQTGINVNFDTSTRILTLTATGGDIAAGVYLVSVQETGRGESARLALVVLPFVQPRTSAPTVELPNSAVAKTASPQASVSFTLRSSHPDGATWRVYDNEAGGTALTTVNASFVSASRTLTLTAAGGDLAVGTYYVSVQESGMLESSRLALTVGFRPTAINNALVLRYEVNAEGTAFTATPSSGSSWNASLESGASIRNINGIRIVDVGASNGYVNLGAELGAVLAGLPEFTIETYVFIPSDTVIAANGNFIWNFSSTASGAAASGGYMSLRATQQRFAISDSGSNNERGTANRGAIERGSWRHVVLTKDSAEHYHVFVDGELMGSVVAPVTVTQLGSLNFNYLAGSIFPGDSFLRNARYYQLNVYNQAFTQEQINNELGADMVLVILPVESRPPVVSFANATVEKTGLIQRQVTFRLDSSHAGDWTWKVYSSAEGGEPLTTISASFWNTHNMLTLTAAGSDIPPGAYFITATESGRGFVESQRVAFTVAPFVQPPKYITINFGGIPSDPINLSGDGASVSRNGGSLTLALATPVNFNRFVWRLNGVVQTAQTGSSFVLSGDTLSALAVGEHRIMVIAVDTNGTPWSGEVAVTVTD